MSELRIDPEQARNLDDALFVDARNPEAWGQSTKKVPGAVRIPANDLESHIDELPRNRTIVTYCT